MKRIYSLILLAAMLCVSVMIQAKPTMIEQQAKKRAQEYKKAGWRILPGELPMEEQLVGLFNTIMETGENNKPRYYNAVSISSACNTLAEAEKQAIILARWQLVEMADLDAKVSTISSQTKLDDVETVYSSSRIVSKFGYITETVTDTENDSFSSYTMCTEGVLMQISTVGGVSDEVIHWDVLQRFCETVPIAKNAWCAFKIYRKTDKGYEVRAEMCNYTQE